MSLPLNNFPLVVGFEMTRKGASISSVGSITGCAPHSRGAFEWPVPQLSTSKSSAGSVGSPTYLYTLSTEEEFWYAVKCMCCKDDKWLYVVG